MLVHQESSKREKCELCGKLFRQKFHLKLHQQRHEGVKNFNCAHCQAAFITKSEVSFFNSTFCILILISRIFFYQFLQVIQTDIYVLILETDHIIAIFVRRVFHVCKISKNTRIVIWVLNHINATYVRKVCESKEFIYENIASITCPLF